MARVHGVTGLSALSHINRSVARAAENPPFVFAVAADEPVNHTQRTT